MRMRSVAFLAASAVVLLASCASGPRVSKPAAELFDSKAVRDQWIPGTLPAPSLPVFADPAPAPAVRPPSKTASPAAAPAPEAAPIASYDAGLVTPTPPHTKAAFALAAPMAPAPMSVQPKAAPVPAQPKAAPARPKPAPQAVSLAPASAPAGAASRPSAAASPSPAAVAQAASAPPRPSSAADSSQAAGSSVSQDAGSYGRLREIYARQGDVLQVGLDGVGFLFLGLPDRQSDGISFKTKENRNDKTWFTFQAVKLGTYDLDFLQQDNMAGKTARETVRVHVVSDQDFNAAVTPQQGQEAGNQGPSETGDAAFAMRLSSLGSYQAAVAELLKGYRDGNPGLNDQIAGLYMKMGSYDAAAKYYGKNVSPQNEYTAAATIGLVRIAALQNDQQALVDSLRRFLALKDPSMEEPLIQAVRMEKARADIGMALDLAAEYVKRFPEGTWRDEADYLVAQLLEADSQFRDIARARALYDSIVTGRPESVFAAAARQRLQYIDRHFIEVR